MYMVLLVVVLTVGVNEFILMSRKLGENCWQKFRKML